MSTRGVTSGASAPLGATVLPSGVNFSVFSKHAILLELLLFDDEQATQPTRIIPLDADRHRTYHYWHVFVPGLRPGQVYAYRAHGTYDPDRGLWFDPEKVLLDPYGLAVAVPETYCFVKANRDEPVHLIDGSSGRVRLAFVSISDTQSPKLI